MDSIRVRIVGNHPHAGEYGTIPVSDDDTVTVEQPLGGLLGKMVRVELEDCIHGSDACYIGPGQMQVIRESQPKRNKRR